MHVEKSTIRREINADEQVIIETLQLCSEICTQQSFEGLFRALREHLPKFFGYQSCGVLIYDRESKCYR